MRQSHYGLAKEDWNARPVNGFWQKPYRTLFPLSTRKPWFVLICSCMSFIKLQSIWLTGRSAGTLNENGNDRNPIRCTGKKRCCCWRQYTFSAFLPGTVAQGFGIRLRIQPVCFFVRSVLWHRSICLGEQKKIAEPFPFVWCGRNVLLSLLCLQFDIHYQIIV